MPDTGRLISTMTASRLCRSGVSNVGEDANQQDSPSFSQRILIREILELEKDLEISVGVYVSFIDSSERQ